MKLIEAVGPYPFINLTQLEIDFGLLPFNNIKKALYRAVKNKKKIKYSQNS